MRTLILITFLAGTSCLVSCNTFIGVTRDVRAAATGLENVAHGRNFNDTGDSHGY